MNGQAPLAWLDGWESGHPATCTVTHAHTIWCTGYLSERFTGRCTGEQWHNRRTTQTHLLKLNGGGTQNKPRIALLKRPFVHSSLASKKRWGLHITRVCHKWHRQQPMPLFTHSLWRILHNRMAMSVCNILMWKYGQKLHHVLLCVFSVMTVEYYLETSLSLVCGNISKVEHDMCFVFVLDIMWLFMQMASSTYIVRTKGLHLISFQLISKHYYLS